MSARCPLCHVPVLEVQPLDATADHGFVQPLIIHLFGFNLLSGWIRGVAVKWSCATQRKAKASDIGFGLLADTLVSALGGSALNHNPTFKPLCASKLRAGAMTHHRPSSSSQPPSCFFSSVLHASSGAGSR